MNLYCQDESRFGLHTHTGRMLTARGVKPVAVAQQEFESVWLFGAFSPIDAKKLLIEMPACNTENFQIFIDELSQTDPTELMIIILDNASFHKANKLSIPDNIILINIPPYAPELNPAKKIWQWYKRAFTNKPFTTLEQISDFFVEQHNMLTDSIIKSTCAYSYLLSWKYWTV